jgi:hypothetical protein
VRVVLQRLTRPSALNGTWQKDEGIRKELLGKRIYRDTDVVSISVSVADPDPGSGALVLSLL